MQWGGGDKQHFPDEALFIVAMDANAQIFKQKHNDYRPLIHV